MDSVIVELEKEHLSIREAIKELSLVKKGCPVGTQALARLERLILNHISKEDSEIYIPLRKLVRLTPEATKFLEGSRQELENVKIFALIFFEKFKGEKTEALCSHFQKDLKRLSTILDKRIDMEDKELFPFLLNLWKKL